MQLRLSKSIVFLGVPLATGLAAETNEAAHSGHFSQLPWNLDPLILASLTLSLFLYLHGLRRMNRAVRSRIVSTARFTAFAAGITALFLVLITPFDALDDQLFSAHMLQHIVLMMIAPPLLILGRPAMAFLWAFPLGVRRAMGRLWVASGLRNAMHRIMSPVVVWLLCSAALWFWHLPGPYGWALESEFVHAVEHLCFFLASLMFWSLVLEPAAHRRLGYGGALLFVATFGVQNGLLGAILTLASRPVYSAHLQTTAAWGLTPLEDQQIAGLLMWIPAGLIYLIALGFLFVAWLRQAERRAQLDVPGRWSTTRQNTVLHGLLIVPVLLLSLSGCDHSVGAPSWKMINANASRGPALIQRYGCGSCHNISSISGATGNVGPSLGGIGQRVYVAGVLRNTPDNLVKWLRNPQSIVPGNAMPNMGVTPQDARDLAAYLYTLPTR